MAAETEFGLLGPLLVRRAGVVTTVSAGKQRALLAALLLKANQVVSVGEISEVLWGPSPPSSERVTIQGLVKRLRRALDGARRRADRYCARWLPDQGRMLVSWMC